MAISPQERNPSLQNALAVSSGAVEATKWFALAAMFVDHVAAVFYDREVATVVTAIGRAAFPMFALVIGYNLARPGAQHQAAALRLLAIGLLAWPAHAYLFGGAQLNVMFTFAAAVGVIVAIDRRAYLLAVTTFTVAGGYVEFMWPGIALVVLSCFANRSHRPVVYVLPILIATAALSALNGNPWAFLAFPLTAAIGWASPAVPRSRWAFYVAYPLHLTVLAVLFAIR